MVSDPLYVLVALGAVIVVHLSMGPDSSPAGSAVRSFVAAGIVLLGLRLVFTALLANPGTTVLFTVPRIAVPAWLGGFGIGGPIKAEVMVAATVAGLRLLVLLCAFGVFNAHADLATLVRGVPSSLRDVGLTVSIAVAFVPGMLATTREVRDAQRLRGERGRKLALSLTVPVLGLGLERAMTLAESMDARGYGSGTTPRASRIALIAGLGGMIAGVGAWSAHLAAPATALVACGALAVVWGSAQAARASTVTKMTAAKPRSFDLAVIGVAAATVGLVTGAAHLVSYDPYPTLTMPAFSVPIALGCLLIAFPAAAPA